MKYNLIKNNNSKKLIIGISILFCAVILIVGGTYSYLTSSDTKELGNIVSSNDTNTYINYLEEKSYMLDNLIPMKSEDVYNAIDNGCVDDYGYNVCSAYVFSLQSTYKDLQKINISMIPTANSFTNLKYLLFRIYDINKMDVELVTPYPMPLEKNNLNAISLFENENLYSDDISTYAVVFYVESMDYDQTEEDAGKSFGATIKVDSLTTGNYIIKSFGADCWDSELVEGTTDRYKLTKFYGLNEDGSVKEECSGFVERDRNGYYSINVPSNHKGNEIKMLGNGLFNARNEDDSLNKYGYIKSVKINEGIEEIGEIREIAEGESIVGLDVAVFGGVGGGIEDNNIYLEVNLPNSLKQTNFASFMLTKLKNINLPSSLEKIGEGSFAITTLETLRIPNNVKYIDKNAFYLNPILSTLTFEGAEDGTSNLLVIGEGAFTGCDLTYTDFSNPLVIPSSVTTIGVDAFSSSSEIQITNINNNINLKYIRFNGTLTAGNTDWYTSIENGGVTTLVP